MVEGAEAVAETRPLLDRDNCVLDVPTTNWINWLLYLCSVKSARQTIKQLLTLSQLERVKFSPTLSTTVVDLRAGNLHLHIVTGNCFATLVDGIVIFIVRTKAEKRYWEACWHSTSFTNRYLHLTHLCSPSPGSN